MDGDGGRPWKRIKLSMEVDDPVDLDTGCIYLPDLAVEQIFSYLNLRDLGRVAQVCKQWYHLSRRSVFWRRVDTQCLSLDRERTEKLLNFLPSWVTHLRLGAARVQCLNMPHISVLLRANCPHLRVLWLNDARVTYAGGWAGTSVAFVLETLPAALRVLALRHSSFLWPNFMVLDKSCTASSIEVLDVSRSYTMGRDALIMASMMPKLKKLCLSGCTVVDLHFQPYYPVIANLWELDLEGTMVEALTFSAVWKYGRNLRELYLCNTSLEDRDLPYKHRLPHLRVFCLRNTQLTWTGVQFVVDSCPSLSRLIISIPYECPKRTMLRVDEKIIRLNDSYRYCDHFARCDYMRDS